MYLVRSTIFTVHTSYHAMGVICIRVTALCVCVGGGGAGGGIWTMHCLAVF